jgi:hypothetical protein
MKIAHRKGIAKRKRREREQKRQQLAALGVVKAPEKAKKPAK